MTTIQGNTEIDGPQSVSGGGAPFGAGSPAAAVEPPCNNMGVGCSNVSGRSAPKEYGCTPLGVSKDVLLSMDWLSVTVHRDLKGCIDYLAALGVEYMERREYGTAGYSQSWLGPFGLVVGTEPKKGQHVNFKLTGSTVRGLGLDAIERFLAILLADGQSGTRVNVTRVDFAIDTQQFSARDVRNVVADEDGPAVGYLKCPSEYGDLRGGSGYTLYLGSPTSLKRLRVYHKTDGDSFGLIVGPKGEQNSVPFTRLELQLRGEAAMTAIASWFWSSPADRLDLVTRWLLGMLDLRGVSWWQSFVRSLSGLKIRVSGKLPDINRKWHWLVTQVARSYAVVCGAFTGGDLLRQDDFIVDFLNMGRERLKRADHELMHNFWDPDTQALRALA